MAEAGLQTRCESLRQGGGQGLTKRKHRRSNREKWDKAWALVQFWYAQLAKEGGMGT